MASRSSYNVRVPLRWSGVIALTATAAMLGACAQSGGSKNGAAALLASYQPKQEKQDELGRALTYWGNAFKKNPRDRDAALSYAKNLKAAGRETQAVAVLRYAYNFHRNDREFAAEYGRLALSIGQISVAQKLLAVADDPAKPDWRVVLGRGTVLAKQGQYKASVPFFERALKLAPSNPTALSNLAMAHAGAGNLKDAEALLRKALLMPNAKPTVRRNLAVVLNLMGRKSEANQVVAGGSVAPIRSTVGRPTQVSRFDRRGRSVATANR